MEENSKTQDCDYDCRLICWLIWQTRDFLYKTRKKELYKHNLCISEAVILYVLSDVEPRITPAELARLIYKDPQAVSATLDKMEKKGLVTRQKNTDRKNQVKICVTQKGAAAYDGPARKMVSAKELMSCLTGDEQKDLLKLLFKLKEKTLSMVL